jgi:ABC-type multidrug transport system fused ATPase/permease subunit
VKALSWEYNHHAEILENMKNLSFIYRFAKKYYVTLILTILSMLLLVGAQLVIPWIIRTLIDTVTGTGVTQDTFNYISTLTLIVFIVLVARAGLSFLRSYMAHIAGWGVVADVRKFVYDHVQHLSLRFYEDKQTGQMMSRVVNDTDLFEQLIAHGHTGYCRECTYLFRRRCGFACVELEIDSFSDDPHSDHHSFIAHLCQEGATSFCTTAKRIRRFECYS